MKKHNRSILIRLSSVLLLLLSIFAVMMYAQKTTAATYSYTVYSGAHYSIQVGDTLYLTNPATASSTAAFRAYNWSGGSGIVSLENISSKTVTLTALHPGSFTLSAFYQEEIPYQERHSKYNSATHKWEYYYTTSYHTNSYEYLVTIDIADHQAPEITAQPSNGSAAQGKVASTCVTASDASRLYYQWYVKKPGQSSFTKSSVTSATYSCKMTAKISGQQVYCVITDEHGNSTRSDTAYLSLLGITKQPSNVYVKNGAKASISVQAEGAGLKYQWYIKDPGKDTFTKSSIKTANYSYTMTKAKSGRQAYCVISNKYGNSVRTKTVTLKIIETVAITKQPAKAFAASGKIVSTTVTAKGDGLKYQWYVKDPGSSTYQKSSITKPTYQITMSSARSGRMVYCLVSDRYGNTVKSKTVSLAMLSIITQPSNQAGVKVSTTVKAQGNGLKYQWYIKNVGSSTFQKSSVTGNTYSTTMTRSKHGRQIYCKITDKYGNSIKSNVCTLSTVAISRHPQSTFGNSSRKAQATVKAIGEGLTYQWYVKDPGMSSFKKSSVTTATYKVNMSESNAKRQVYCIVKDKFGNSVRSKTVTLYYLEITQQAPRFIYGKNNEKVTATIKAAGEDVTYHWYHSSDGKTYNPVNADNQKNSFSTNVIALDYYADYVYCVVKDKYGNSIKSTVTTMVAFEIRSQRKIIAVGPNRTDTVSIDAVGSKLTYEWHPYLAGCPDTPVLSTDPEFTVDGNFAKKYPMIYCIITDSFGNQFVSDLVSLNYLS